MFNVNQRRRNGKIDKLPTEIREEVEQRILTGVSYREIVEYLKTQDVELSRMAVCTYAKKFLATTQMLRIAHENFRMLTDELEQYPYIDTTEGIIRVMSNAILNTLANTSMEDWQSIKIENLMKQATSLIRATTRKRTKKESVQTEFNSGVQMLFDVMREKDPELTERVRLFINAEKESFEEKMDASNK